MTTDQAEAITAALPELTARYPGGGPRAADLGYLPMVNGVPFRSPAEREALHAAGVAAPDPAAVPDPAALVGPALRLRDAVRAFGGENDPAKDYAALLAERDAAVDRIVRLAGQFEAAGSRGREGP